MSRKEKLTAHGQRTIRSPNLGSHSDHNESTTAATSTRHRTKASSRGPSPSSVPSDYEFFQLSDSPDDWEDEEDKDKEWPVKAVVGEAILGNRQIRRLVDMKYVEWEGWQRDGKSTTWTIGLPGANSLIDAWDAARAKERREKAKKSPDIDLSELDNYLPHDFRTFEQEAAYEEKKYLWEKKSKYWREWVAMDDDRGEEKEKEREEEKRVVGREGRDSTVPSREMSRKRKRPPEPSVSGSRPSGSRPSGSRLAEEGSALVDSLASSSRQSHLSSSTRISHSQTNARSILQHRWNRALNRVGAAKVTLVNEVDDEECPVLTPGFSYLENYCNRDVGVPDAGENKAFMLGCECEDGCDDVLRCSCLLDSDCTNEFEEPTSAYDANGLFLFNNKYEVVECNENCACKRNCTNAVVQKVRKIPIEVFKTRNNGWGARTPVPIPMGTVLGFYTGKIMKRKELAKVPANEREHSFDLDVRDDQDGLKLYSVCAHKEGNWTRFINHSCSPNTVAYSVVFDAPVAVNMPYIVMTASKDIPARQEITIDYNPAAAWGQGSGSGTKTAKKKAKRKGKGKARSIEGEDVEMVDAEERTVCLCGSEVCRGFI